MKHIAKQTTTVDGQRLTYYKLGRGTPLLFLHGGRVRAKTFRKVIERLAEDYMVIAPDVPGYGDSDTPHDTWSFTEYADFFDSFLRTLQIDHVTVVGYSMGGGIAFNLAARSHRVGRLVLINAAGLPLPGAKPNHHDMRRLAFYVSHPQYFSTLYTLTLDFLRFIWKHRRDWKYMKAIRRQCFITSYLTALDSITTPTTILWGRDDWILPVRIAERFQASIPHARLYLVSGNHDWLIYSPQLIELVK